MENLAILEPEEMESKPKMDETIFDHIRRKSKSFPDLMTLKTMDPFQKPLILTEANASTDQCALGSFKTEEDCMILIDSEPFETFITPMDQCGLESSQHQEDGVILNDRETVDSSTQSNDAAKYTLLHNFDRNKKFTNSAKITNDQPDKTQLFNLKSGDMPFVSKVSLIENSASIINSEISTNSSNTLANKRKLAANNWTDDDDDVMVKGCKRHRPELASGSLSTISKQGESELCDSLFKVTTEGCGNSMALGPSFSLDPPQVSQQSSCFGTPGGSMEVSFLGFKSVFSFL